MSSQKQVEANRKNSQKSTGPKTIQGKCVVSHNSVKHGILSSRVTIDDEEQDRFTEFAMRLNGEFTPSDPIQELLVDRIISCAWRLQRLVHIETLLMQKSTELQWGGKPMNYGEVFRGCNIHSMSILSRYERSIENALYRALILLRELQKIVPEESSFEFEI